MKKQLIGLVALFGFMTSASAELTQSELNRLTSQQRQIYMNQLKELNQNLKQLDRDLFRAEDMIRMGEEMNREEGNKAGAVHVMRGMELKEKTTKQIKETQNALVLLDKAARDAIKNNENNKK